MNPLYEDLYVEDSEEYEGDPRDDRLDYHGDFLHCLDPKIVEVICR